MRLAILSCSFAIAYGLAFVLLDGRMIAMPVGVSILIGALLVWISVEDAMHCSIPLVALLAFATAATVAGSMLSAGQMMEHLAAAIAYGALFELVNILGRREDGTLGLGRGDTLLVAGASLLLGPIAPIHVIAIAATMALVFFALAVLSRAMSTKDPLPFGPFLSGAIWLIFLDPDLLRPVQSLV